MMEQAIVNGAITVFASVADMECGFSRELFMQYASNPDSTVILTSRTAPGTLARRLIDSPTDRNLTLEVRRRERLEGAELEEHMRRQKEKETEAARAKADRAKKEREELESSDESEDEDKAETVGGIIRTKHDLMMKNEGKARTGFFKQAKKSFPMFPLKEEKIRWDEYGEIIRPEDFIILETQPAEEEKMDTSAAMDTATRETADLPTKCVTSIENVEVACNVVYIDFEGRSDGESIRKILGQIKPRQIAIVRGETETAEALADYCRSTRDLVQGSVFVPKLNEIVDATTESHIYQVRLKDSVVSALQFYKARDYEVAWIDAVLDLSTAKKSALMDEDGNEKREAMETDEESTDLVPTVEPCPPQMIEGHSAVFVNEPKLSDFKQVLLQKGIPAEFSAGALICSNTVAVRRNEAGRLQLEGCLSKDYYRVRSLLYDQFAIV